MLPTRDPPETRDLNRLKVKGYKKKYSKQTRKKGQGSNTYMRKNRLQNKGHKKRHRRTFHNTQGKNPPGRNKHYKYICTQHRSTQIHTENLGGLGRKILTATQL